MDQPTVLLISDDPDFSRLIAARWQSERSVPVFTLMSSDVSMGLDPENFQLAIAGRIRPEAVARVLENNHTAGKRVLFVSEDARTLQTLRDRWPGVTVVRQEDNWLDTVVLVAGEILHRCAAESRASRAETAKTLLERQATLGCYMLEMRHTLNNILTAVLGNSELLLLEPGMRSAEVRSQIETIRNMAVRMHEILQRFSSLEKELTAVDQQAGKESHKKAMAVAAVQ